VASSPPLSPTILGIFRGAPYGQKASADPWSHLPSSIVLYQRNLERFAADRDELVEQIGVTLLHEVGHFLGLDEEELAARGLD
jgi:predicted Zn-dependent protease with MMP-like domain